MNSPRSWLLERRLTLRMIGMQFVTLVLFFGVGVFPFTIYPILAGIGDIRPLDPRVTTVFAKSLAQGADGALVVRPSNELTELVKNYPHMWLYAQAAQGQPVAFGAELPDIAEQLKPSLPQLNTLDVAASLDGQDAYVVVRTEKGPSGPIKIATGGGPTVGLASMVKVVSTAIILAAIFTLALVSVLAIPRVVRHELRGLKRAAGQAEHIDVGPVGRRLSEEDLPAEVHSLVRAINDALARLDETYIRRERFLADSAHELRTPIAILQTRLETAEPFPERAKLLVDVARLSSLAGQLLDLQRLDLEGSALETIDLVELASRVVGDLAPLAIVGGYELSLNAPSEPVLVAADPTSLGRAFTNIIQNAIAYGGNRGTIEVEVTKNGTVEIGDDGPGIPVVDRARIFEPFYRAKPLSQGAGLGLNLVENIVRKHHGHIAAVESPSGGARFVITLPLAGQRKVAAA
jgi:signal transduction histidine kinase